MAEARQVTFHPITTEITADFCDALTDLSARPLPPSVRHASRRTLLNVVATAIGASRSAPVNIVVGYARAHGGTPVAPVPGRQERLDLTGAALATGIAAHYDDFDDTHLATVIHPGAPALATVVPLGAANGTPGETALRAFALGCEAQLRLGNAICPGHYDAGWHITGTCGVVGAAVAAAVMLGLDASGMRSAVGLAATQTLGHREAFGSMTKPFHPGQAAANGLLAALLAQQGFPGPEQIFERANGFFAAFTPVAHPGELLAGLGESWELDKNTFKPYPCGIVSHPLIDAAIAVAPRIPGPDRVAEIVAHCHPLVVELMGRMQPADGLQARFSAAHTIAAAIADGELTLRQFRDSLASRADIRRLRAITRLVPSPDVGRDEARLEVRLADGTTLREHVAHARGSLIRPLSDDELAAKARGLIEPVLPGHADRIVAASQIDGPGGLAALIEAMTPEPMTPEPMTPEPVTTGAITPGEGDGGKEAS
jgi:2-methylcitrate dehydratase PrpD